MKKRMFVYIYTKTTRGSVTVKTSGKSVAPRGYILHSFKEVTSGLDRRDYIARTLRKIVNGLK